MDDVLLGIVLGRLAKFPLPEQAADLLLAALDGDESLSAQLTGQAQPRSAAPAVTTPSRPPGAYLQSLTVSGFRGIGLPATLAVSPRPGLTLVVGRNGSGKSSFAEALEVLLTGNLRRWDKLPVVWRQGWRSVHHPDQAKITAEFVVEGTGSATAHRTWPTGADFAASSASVQVSGEKQAGIERLGWTAALTDYRPFLSHSELEAFFGSPSGLYELLASVLGLEDLTMAATRLAQARRTREATLNEVKKRLPALLTRLEAADDERAPACHRALAGRSWDLAAARSAATGSPDGGPRGRVRSASSPGSARRPSRDRRSPDRGRAPPRRRRARCRRGLGRWPGASAGRVADRRAAASRCARGRELPGVRPSRCADHAVASGHRG